jgi:ribosomal-protein-alanine N-acetyltransferase
VISTFESERLIVRSFLISDLNAIHKISNEAFGEIPLDARRNWLTWCISNEIALSELGQPPYGDRAIVRKSDQRVIGSVGLVPSMGPFDTLPSFASESDAVPGLFTPEVGLFWSLGKAYRGQGYATEAASLLVDFAFDNLRLKRIVATTEHDNNASIAVMRRLGMRIERNPNNEPIWFQTIGVLDNPALGK